ncbi:MAG: hypothetical protein WC900_02520 [Oscillospiraceae bacterium]|jgi:hypothetical protein
MDDLMSKLQDVLSDEESMNQIKKLAGMLSDGSDSSMPDLSSVFGAFSQPDDKRDKAGSSSQEGFDFSKLTAIQQMMSQANKKDANTELLYALKPLLKSETQLKVDKLVKIFKLMAMWPLLKESGILGGDLFDFL